MIKSLRKIFGVESGELGNAAAASARPRNLYGHKLVTNSMIGQTMVVTVIEHELNVNTAADICWEIRELYEHASGVRHIVLDMENIQFVDSAGLNQLVDLLGVVKKRQGRLGIAAATTHVEVLFKLTRLELVFTIRRTVIDAIDAIEPKE